MFEQPLLKVLRNTGVVPRVVQFADEKVNVEHGVQLLARQAVAFGALREKFKIKPAFTLVTAWQPPLWNATH